MTTAHVRLKRAPRLAVLRPFVHTLWAIDETHETRVAGVTRERVLPTGWMHVVIRLSDTPLRLLHDDGASAENLANALVGGARCRPYLREFSGALCSVGAQLLPGAAPALFGVPADALAGRHTPLEDLWHRAGVEMRERLAELPTLERRLDAFEAMLAAKLPRLRGLHPAVAEALEQFETRVSIGDAVARAALSHRAFIAQFRRAVGFTPKLYCRLMRFQRVLQQATTTAAPWSQIALDASYSDQAHLVREFREFAGVTPAEYRRSAAALSHHVALADDA
jgi:AraC-like DNA-binding protein